MHVVGIDIGSTGTKLVVLDPGGRVIADATAPVDQFSDRAGYSEADPAQWWRNVCALIPEVLPSAGVDSREIGGVAGSGGGAAGGAATRRRSPRAASRSDGRSCRTTRVPSRRSGSWRRRSRTSIL